MRAVLNQEEIVPVANRAKPPYIARKTEIVDCHDRTHAGTDSHLDIHPVRFTIPSNGIKLDLGPKVLKRFDCRRTEIGWKKDLLARLDSQGAHTVVEGVARPKEVNVLCAFHLARRTKLHPSNRK